MSGSKSRESKASGGKPDEVGPLEGKPRSTRLRRLTDDEIELWLTVASTVARRAGSVLPPPPAAARSNPVSATAIPAPLPPAPAARVTLPPLAPLERKLKQKLSRGRMTADAAIDLHGLRQGEAHVALLRFLDRGQRQGFRVVLVVTGKGGRVREDEWGSGEGTTGVLRRQVPLWLALPEFRTLVLGWEEAGRPHGGAGALYVRLRRGTHSSQEYE